MNRKWPLSGLALLNRWFALSKDLLLIPRHFETYMFALTWGGDPDVLPHLLFLSWFEPRTKYYFQTFFKIINPFQATARKTHCSLRILSGQSWEKYIAAILKRWCVEKWQVLAQIHRLTIAFQSIWYPIRPIVDLATCSSHCAWMMAEISYINMSDMFVPWLGVFSTTWFQCLVNCLVIWASFPPQRTIDPNFQNPSSVPVHFNQVPAAQLQRLSHPTVLFTEEMAAAWTTLVFCNVAYTRCKFVKTNQSNSLYSIFWFERPKTLVRV